MARWRDGDAAEAVEDVLAVEEPLEIRIGGRSWTMTMRTPGDDEDLVRGLLVTEGVVRWPEEIAWIRPCRDTDGEAEPNVLDVRLEGVEPAARAWQRTLMAGASCGLCGKTTIEALRVHASPIASRDAVRVGAIRHLPETLRAAQTLFSATGGVHAAGLFTANGRLLASREDIGRHNATDKVIGAAFASGMLARERGEGETESGRVGEWGNGRPGEGERAGGTGSADRITESPNQSIAQSPNHPIILLVSGRASFEIVQKALVAGIPVVAAVSAASQLAVDLAREGGITLVGFLRAGGFTVYCGGERIVGSAA